MLIGALVAEPRAAGRDREAQEELEEEDSEARRGRRAGGPRGAPVVAEKGTRCRDALLTAGEEIDECEGEEKRLSAQKDLHIRELKRVMDEDKSRFNDCPVLPADAQRKAGQDFVLLTLLGKGGFRCAARLSCACRLRSTPVRFSRRST